MCKCSETAVDGNLVGVFTYITVWPYGCDSTCTCEGELAVEWDYYGDCFEEDVLVEG